MRKIFYSLCFFAAFTSCSNNKKESELNVYLQEVVPGIDPTFTTDRTSNKVISNIYEGLYSYDYLKRPLVLEPVVADSLPIISNDGLNYLIKLKKGVHFTNNPCFENSIGREVVANDFIYSIKRFLSTKKTEGMLLAQVLKETVVGAKEFIESKDPDKINKEIKGLIAKDIYTIEINLIKTSVFFPDVLTRPNASIIAKEAVDYYKDKFSIHPVGTGPFILETIDSGVKIVLKKNQNYKHYKYPSSGSTEDTNNGLLTDAGKDLPLVDKINLYILPEDQPRWLNFVKGNIDIALPDKDSYYNAFPMGEISKDLAVKGVKVYESKVFDVWFYAFNMEKTILGKNKYLRQAITLAYDTRQHNTLFYNNKAILAHDLIPPGLFAYDDSYTNPYTLYNLEKAKELLAKAGYPDGKGLPKFRFLIRETIAARQMGEYFAKSMSKIGINIELIGLNFRDLLKKVYETRDFDIASLRWRADVPFAEDFLRLLYSKSFPNGPNHSRYSNKEYDALYEKLVSMSNSENKLTYFKKIREIYTEDCPLILLLYPTNTYLTQNYVENFKTNPIFEDTEYKFLKINEKLKKTFNKN